MRLGRVPSVALVMMVTIAVVRGIGWVIFNQLIGVVNELPGYQENIHAKLEAMRARARQRAFGSGDRECQRAWKRAYQRGCPRRPAGFHRPIQPSSLPCRLSKEPTLN